VLKFPSESNDSSFDRRFGFIGKVRLRTVSERTQMDRIWDIVQKASMIARTVEATNIIYVTNRIYFQSDSRVEKIEFAGQTGGH